jgi:uncharacterized membrane protein
MFAITLACIATCCMQIGYLLWKRVGDTLPGFGTVPFFTLLKKFFTNKVWLLGLCALDFGWILSIKAIELGAFSIVQPLLSAGSFFAVLLAVVFLRERLVRMEWLGMCVTVLGAVCVSFATANPSTVTVEWYTAYVWIATMSGITVLATLIGLKRKKAEVVLAGAAGMSFALGGILTKLMSVYIHDQGEMVTFISAFKSPYLLPVIVANVVGLFLVQVAFQKGRIAIIIPLYAAMVSGVSVLAGAYLFDETIHVIHVLGVCFIFFGSVMLEYTAQDKGK